MHPVHRKELRRYLTKTQGMESEAVMEMDDDELIDLYEHYHEY